MVRPFLALIGRDLRLALRGGIGSLVSVVFFVIAVALFPLGVGPALDLLERIAPGVLWVCALLAAMLSLDRMFHDDFEDGSLEQIALGTLPLELVALSKAIAHWLTTCLPLVIIAPLLGLMLNVEMGAMGALVLTLAAGTPALTFIGLIGAALSVALRRGGLLLAVLVLPLTIPVLIFGVAAANAAIDGAAPFGPPFTILCALSLMSFVLGPVAAAAALRYGLE